MINRQLSKKIKFFLFFLLISFQVISAQVLGDFRSLASGAWNTNASWQRFDGTTWVNSTAGIFPGATAGSYSVTIQTGHIINGVNAANYTIGNLTVKGTMRMNTNNMTMTINTPYLHLDGGTINYNVSQSNLILPANVRLDFSNSGAFTDSGACNANKIVTIGTTVVASCNGGGAAYDFATFNALATDLSSTINKTDLACLNKSVQLQATGSSANAGATFGYSWSGTGPSGYTYGPSATNPITINQTTPGIYTFTSTTQRTDVTTFTLVDVKTISYEILLDSDGDCTADTVDLDDDNDGILDTLENPCTLTRSTTWSGTGSPVAGVNGSGVSTNNITMTSVAASGANTSFTASPNDTFNTTNFWSNPAVAGANSLQFVHAWDTTPEDTQQASVDGGTRTYTITFAKPVNKAIIHLDRLGGNYQIPPANYFSNSTEFTLTSSGISMKKLAGNNQLIVSTNKFYRNVNVDLGSVNPGSEANNTTGSAAGSIEFSSTTGQLFTSLTFSVAGQGIEGQGNDGIEFIIESCIGTDTDGDGIPNNLDLDSDGDGCPDAIEGAGAFTTLTPSSMPGGNSGASYNGLSSAAVTQNLGNTVGNTATTMGVPTVAGTGQDVGQSQNGFKNDCQDADGDLIPDWQDLDDDNDGILDTTECPTTVNDFIAAFGAGATTDILPSDFGLALNVKNQNVTRDLSAKFGYPANSGAVFVSITNASVHPTSNVWWTKNGEQPSIWKVTGTVSAFLAMGHDLLYYANDSKTFHMYDNADVIPVTVPGLANQTAVAGQWSIIDTQSQKTLNNLNTNSGTQESGNWRYINMNFGPKSFGFSTTVASGEPNYGITVILECDTDQDGIPNRLDLDSDNDNCLDVVEGGNNLPLSNLVAAGGTLSVGTGSTASNQNLCGGTTCVGSTGIPTIVNQTTGQSVGSSANAGVKAAVCLVCYIDANTALAGIDSKHGITLLKRAGSDNGNWPMIRKSAHTVLESNTKGFVVTRMTSDPVQTAANNHLNKITNPQDGMMVYDLFSKCLKIYMVDEGTPANSAWRCFNAPTCQ